MFKRVFSVEERKKSSRFHIRWSQQLKLIVVFAFLLALASGVAIGFHGFGAKAQSPHHNPVNDAVNYALGHWNWTNYNNSTPVHRYHFQNGFQSAEFVARSIAAAGPIGNLTPKSEGYNQLTYNGKAFNLKLVSGLYQFLVAAHVASDAGTNLNSLQLGDLVILGKPDGSIDFEHIAIVTNTTDPSNPLLTQHNWADIDFPAALLNSFKDEHGAPMVVTHIVRVNYAMIAGGQLSSALAQEQDLRMEGPAPYHTHTITSGLYVGWEKVKGATGYAVMVTDMNGNIMNVIARTAIQETFFKIDLSHMRYGNYNYYIQPLSASASFGVFYDTFNYEPASCIGVPQDSGIGPSGTHTCFTASGTY